MQKCKNCGNLTETSTFCCLQREKNYILMTDLNLLKGESIAQEAERIINGPRRDAYGSANESFQRIANVWNSILFKSLSTPITAAQVALMMAGFKLCREANKEGRDNRVDMIGYLLLEQLIIDNNKEVK